MTEMNDYKRKLALALFDIGAIQDKHQSPEGKGFKLKLHEIDPDALLSPVYLNFRTPDNPKPGPLTPDIIAVIGKELYKMARLSKLRYSHVAGVPRAGNPLSEAFSETATTFGDYKIPVLELVKEDSDGGRQIVEIIKGECHKGERVLLVDDLITGAHSKLEAIKVLENGGMEVNDVLVLVDRQQGGPEQLKEKGYTFHAVFTFSELLDLYLNAGKMDQATYDEINAYLAANR